MNDSATLNTVHVLWGNWTNSLCVVDKTVTEPPELSAYQGHKSSTEAEMYCESTAWGRAARALRHPPTLPDSAVSVATGAEGGGGKCSVKVKRQTFETRWVNGWMDGWIYWGMGDKGIWQGQWGAAADSSASQSLTDWRSEEAQQQHPQCEKNTEGIFFHPQWQRKSQSRLRGSPIYTQSMSLCKISVSHMVLFRGWYFSALSVRKSNVALGNSE